MCGIAGWLGRLDQDRETPDNIMRVMHHRGPDAKGCRRWSEAALIHTRLSIIDLSPAGAQPMANEDETVFVVCNGEIYNHRELRKELEARGHRFHGGSDTEVLPHLYEEEGPEFPARLRGMFAIAVYDSRNKTLLLARDRFGIKPLFYAPQARRLAFASELNALLEVPGIERNVDRQALYDFASLCYIPAPETFYRSIKALQPGELVEAGLHDDDMVWRTKTYHRWVMAPNPALTLEDAANRAEELINTAVSRQMEADVPLGCLLSGGIDSSLVSAATQSAAPNGNGIATFNVRFADKEYDETWAALAVAEGIGSRHRTLDMESSQGSWEQITGLLRHVGQPFADTSLFPVHAVCRYIRRYLTVVLSGDGGDEGFGGYDLYWRMAAIARCQRLPRWMWQGGLQSLGPLARLGLIQNQLRNRVEDLLAADDTTVLEVLGCWIREKERQRLCRDTDVLPIRRLFEQQWEHDLSPRASRIERLSALATEVGLRLTLPNDYLFKMDMASMRESIELRVPMLDEDLIGFGLTLPHRLKVKARECKIVLREVAKRRLPREVAVKPKRGFSVPVDTWVDAAFKARVGESLLSDSSCLTEFFQPEVYKPWVQAFCGGYRFPGISRAGLYQRVIMLLSVHLTLQGGKRENPLINRTAVPSI